MEKKFKANLIYDYQISNKINIIKLLSLDNLKLFCTISENETKIKIWNVKKMRLFKVLHCNNNLYDIFYLPFHKLLIISSNNSIINFWNPISGQCLKILKVDKLIRISFAMIDNILIYYGCTDIRNSFNTYFYIWNFSNKIKEIDVKYSKYVEKIISINNNNDRIAISYKNCIDILNYKLNIYIKTLKIENYLNFNHLAYIYNEIDQNDFLVTCDQCSIKVWDLLKFKMINTIKILEPNIIFFKTIIIKISKILIVAYQSGVISFINVLNGKDYLIISDLKNDSNRICSLLITLNNSLILTSYNEGKLKGYEIKH